MEGIYDPASDREDLIHMEIVLWRNYLRTAAWFLLVALLFKSVLLFRKYAPWIHDHWNEVGKGFAIFLVLIALSAMLFWLFRPKTKVAETEGQAVWYILAVACGLLFAIFYLHDITYNPLVLWGEWRSSIGAAIRIWNNLSVGSFYPPSIYNIGMGYFYLPLYATFGESIWAAKIMYLVCWILALSALTVVWKRWYGNEGMLSVLVIVSTLAYGLAVQRNYKWHVISVLLVATMFWIISQIERHQRVIGYLFLLIALSFGIICYYICFIYLIFMIFYLLLGHESRPVINPIWARQNIVFFILIAITVVFYIGVPPFFSPSFLPAFMKQLRISGHLTGNRLTFPSFYSATFLELFFKKISSMASLTLVLGLGAGIVNFKKDWIARFSIVGFFVISMVIMLTTPFHDIAHGNYVIVFVFLVMAYGIYSFLIRIPWTIVRQIVVVSLAWYLVWQEYPIYEANFWSNGCYALPGVVALYDMKMSEISHDKVIFVSGRGTEEAFPFELFSDVSPTYEYSYLSRKLLCCRSLEGLRPAIESLITTPAAKHGSIKAYLATSVDRKHLDEVLKGLHYLCYEISYFEQEWHGKVPVYKLVILQ